MVKVVLDCGLVDTPGVFVQAALQGMRTEGTEGNGQQAAKRSEGYEELGHG
jgi:hypothetical protein